MRVLVVDDDPNVRSSIRRTLARNSAAEVLEASDGMSALEMLINHPCDLVVLDLRMPVMDGIQTLRAIRRSPTQGSVPVVMLTGIADEAFVTEALKLGVVDYLIKPVPPAELFARIARVLARHGPVPDAAH